MFHLTSLIIGTTDVKIDVSVLEEKSSIKMLGLSFSSDLDCNSYIASIIETVSKKIIFLIRSMKFFSPEVALYLYIFTIRPYLEYCSVNVQLNWLNWFHFLIVVAGPLVILIGSLIFSVTILRC